MEKIVRKYLICFIIGFCVSTVASAQRTDKTIISKTNNRFENSDIVQYYVTERATIDYFTFSLEKMEIDKDFVHIYFFSEVNDYFEFYIDDVKVKKERVNTLGYDGRGKDPLVRLGFPDGKNEFTLKVISSRYGSFETIAKKGFPMVYIKSDPNEWYITHSDVYRLPYKYFTRN